MSKDFKILGPPVGYVDILDSVTVEDSKARGNKGPGKRSPLRPSSAGKCTRELAYETYEFLQKKRIYPRGEEMKAETVRLLDLGWFIENHLLKWFKKCTDYFDVELAGQVIDLYELEAKSDPSIKLPVLGTMDAAFISPEKGWHAFVDFKSKKDKFHHAFKSAWDELSDKLDRMPMVGPIGDAGRAFWVDDIDAFVDKLGDPFFEANFVQLNQYLLSDFAKRRGVDHGAIIQSAKNDSRLREIRFKPSQRLFDRTRHKFQLALDAAAAGDPELAPRDYALGSIKCAFCPFNKTCWGDVNALKEYFSTFKKEWPKDSDRLETGEQLEEAFRQYEKCEEIVVLKDKLEAKIMALMENERIGKVRLDSGAVYELKFLKSPRPHTEIRRSKA